MKRKNSLGDLAQSRFEKAESSPGYLFWKTYNIWQRTLQSKLSTLGITQVQYSILAAVSYLSSTSETLTQQDVSNQLSMDKMMVSDVVKTLLKKDYLIRSQHPVDGRSFKLDITPSGLKILTEAVPIVEETDDHFFSKGGKDSVKKLVSILNILSNS